MNQVVTTTPTIGSNVEEVEYKNLKFLMWVSMIQIKMPLKIVML